MSPRCRLELVEGRFFSDSDVENNVVGKVYGESIRMTMKTTMRIKRRRCGPMKLSPYKTYSDRRR